MAQKYENKYSFLILPIVNSLKYRINVLMLYNRIKRLQSEFKSMLRELNDMVKAANINENKITSA